MDGLRSDRWADHFNLRLRHPFRSFEALYVAKVRRRLARGLPHPTLGPVPLADGREELCALQRFGLLPEHVVIDFGCGSLRVGGHLIEFLDAGHYWGLDVTDAFFPTALPPAIAAKSPKLRIISNAALRQAARTKPEFVFAEGVLQCVPPWRLKRLMRQLWMLASDHTKTLVSFLEADATCRLHEFAFRYSLTDVERSAVNMGFDVVVLSRGTEPLALRDGSRASRDTRATHIMLTRAPS